MVIQYYIEGNDLSEVSLIDSNLGLGATFVVACMNLERLWESVEVEVPETSCHMEVSWNAGAESVVDADADVVVAAAAAAVVVEEEILVPGE